MLFVLAMVSVTKDSGYSSRCFDYTILTTINKELLLLVNQDRIQLVNVARSEMDHATRT